MRQRRLDGQKRAGVNRTLLIVLTILWVIFGALSGFLAMTSFFLFDAPGSESSKLTIAVFWMALTMPAWWLAGAIVPWFFRKRSYGWWFFAIPLVDVVALVTVAIAIQQYCGGNLACPPAK
jgi:hypothetical protein